MTDTALHIDFETTGVVDLRRTGSSRYSKDKDTRVLCLGFAFDDEDADIWFPTILYTPALKRILSHVQNGGEIHAWNAGFEIDIWENTCIRQFASWPRTKPGQWVCTQARAAYWGLPAGLADACMAIGSNILIDPAKNSRMMRMARPRLTLPDGTHRWWDKEEPQRLKELGDDCINDVEAERQMHRLLPDPPDRERQIWLLDRKMNRRGIAIDSNLAGKLKALATVAKDKANAELRKLTQGAVTTGAQTARVLEFVQRTVPEVTDLKRETIDEYVGNLTSPSTEPGLRALQLRRQVSNSSPAKLDAMFTAVDPDGRVRGSLKYYGAGRTGRWSGAGGTRIQLQNLPRGTISDVALAVRMILDGKPIADLEMLFEDGLLGIVSSCLRACFVAQPNEELVSMDFSQIEARVIAWLSGQKDLLDVFARGEDVYVYAASRVGSRSRLLGKVITLALGFGMGWIKFIDTAKTYGLSIDEGFARQTVAAWRSSNNDIVQFWWDLEGAFRNCIESKVGTEIRVNKFVSVIKGQVGVAIKLPSGRLLVYRDARLEDDGVRPNIVYAGVHPKTKQWSRDLRTYGGKLAENVTQAVARDVMADAMLAADSFGLDLCLSVHDEVLALAQSGVGDRVKYTMGQLMNVTPPWAPGLPVAAAGWHGQRYKKG